MNIHKYQSCIALALIDNETGDVITLHVPSKDFLDLHEAQMACLEQNPEKLHKKSYYWVPIKITFLD